MINIKDAAVICFVAFSIGFSLGISPPCLGFTLKPVSKLSRIIPIALALSAIGSGLLWFLFR